MLWQCLHGGPLTRNTIEQLPADNRLSWERNRKRNVPLLVKLTRTYGPCAIVARDGDRIVGQLRFYPKAVWQMAGAGDLCLQQDYPAGPADAFADGSFLVPAQLEDKTLVVNCLMAGCPQQDGSPYRSTHDAGSIYQNLLSRLLNRVFGGDSLALVTSIFEAKPPNREQLAQLEELLNDMKKKHGRKEKP